MEYNFFDVRIGTRTRAGNLNVIHSFVCKSTEQSEYKVTEFFQKRYTGFSLDVIRITEFLDITNENLNLPVSDPFASNDNELKSKIRELEKEIKKLKESKNSTFTMEIHSDDINVDNKQLYKKVVEDYKVYTESVLNLEKGIKNELMEKYKPFASSINTNEHMNGNNKYMRFQLNLKAKLF